MVSLLLLRLNFGCCWFIFFVISCGLLEFIGVVILVIVGYVWWRLMVCW